MCGRITIIICLRCNDKAENILSQLGIPMSTAINIYLNRISLAGGIPFQVTLPAAPENINEDLMSAEELQNRLYRGIDDAEKGNVRPASEAFDEFREEL